MNATTGPAIEAYWVSSIRRGTPGFQRAHSLLRRLAVCLGALVRVGGQRR